MKGKSRELRNRGADEPIKSGDEERRNREAENRGSRGYRENLTQDWR